MINAGSSLIENVGVTKVNVTDDATALQGVSLNAYNASVDFSVSDNVASISSVLTVSELTTSTSHTSPPPSGQNGHGGMSPMTPVINTNGFVTNLDDANSVIVTSGVATVSEADAIQEIAKYSGAASDYDITDTAAALISAGDDVLDVAGVDIVRASDTSVKANIGGDLAGFTADIEFDVVDNADAIAIEVAASGTGAGSLDEANNVAVVSGDVTASEADAIQDIAKYSGADSDYDITDNACLLYTSDAADE